MKMKDKYNIGERILKYFNILIFFLFFYFLLYLISCSIIY